MKLLGIGSRIKHNDYSLGVVTNVTSKHYWVTFIENGLETIEVNSEFEVIEYVEDEVDTISFYEVETTLKKMLKKIAPAGGPKQKNTRELIVCITCFNVLPLRAFEKKKENVTNRFVA